MSVTVAVVIPTFNRRRMLYEALCSVMAARPDEVVLIDDGTDAYDVADMFQRCFVLPAAQQGYPTTFRLLSAPPITVDMRMSTPRQARLINEALRDVRCDVVTMLCDDDLFAPGWLDAIRQHWTEYPERELVRGDWLMFEDGEIPTLDDPPCPLDRAMSLTAGNFAHHISLTRDRGVQWPENKFNCLDAGFLESVRAAKVDVFRVPTIGLAGWARFHDFQNGLHSDGSRHRNSLRPLLAGYLEAAR